MILNYFKCFMMYYFNTQVQIVSNRPNRLYETIDLEITGTVLNDIYLDLAQEELYILTSREVSPTLLSFVLTVYSSVVSITFRQNHKILRLSFVLISSARFTLYYFSSWNWTSRTAPSTPPVMSVWSPRLVAEIRSVDGVSGKRGKLHNLW